MDRIELVRAAYERFMEEDIPGVLEFLDPDVEMPDLIRGSMICGKEAVGLHWQRHMALAEHSVILSEVLELGEAVIVIAYHQRYERDGMSLGHGVSTVQRFTFRGDKIAKIEVTALDPIPPAVVEKLG